MYLVAGVTGHTGSVVADTLLARGEKVRVLVRSAEKGAPWAAKGAELAVGALDDRESLLSALQGVQGAYLLSPPDYVAEDYLASRAALTDVLASAVGASSVGHVVFLSSVGADVPDGTGPIRSLAAAEPKLRATGKHVTALRPAYFMENWGAAVHPAKSDGVLPTFLNSVDFRFPNVATHDIGVEAAGLLLEGTAAPTVVELAGPADYTPTEVAAVFAAALGRPVNAVTVPQEAQLGILTGAGLQPGMAALFVEMYRGIEQGKVAFRGEPRRGKTPIGEVVATLVR